MATMLQLTVNAMLVSGTSSLTVTYYTVFVRPQAFSEPFRLTTSRQFSAEEYLRSTTLPVGSALNGRSTSTLAGILAKHNYERAA